MNELPPLPDDLLDYIAAEREPEVPAPAARERIFARLVPLLPPIGGIGGGSTSGAPPSPGAGSVAGAGAAAGTAGAGAAGAVAGGAWQGKLLVAALSAAIGAGGGAATHAMLAAPRAVPLFVATPIAPALAAPIERARGVAAAQPSPEAAAPEESAAPAATSGRASTDERVRGTASLRAERLLLEAANAALLRGDHASAIASLRKHAQSFPKGELAQEREILLVQALKASGDDAAAEQKAKDFKQKFPGSMQQETVDKAARPR